MKQESPELRAFLDAIYHRYKVHPSQQLPAVTLVETRAARFLDLVGIEPNSPVINDPDLMRHWAVGDLLADKAASPDQRGGLRSVIYANAEKNRAYAATIAVNAPDLLTPPTSTASVVDLTYASMADSRLAELGYRMEPSLSSLDSEDDTDALVELETGELVDPPSEEIRELALAWAAEQLVLVPARQAMSVITANRDRLRDDTVTDAELETLVAADAKTYSSLMAPDQLNIAAALMAESAAAHPHYFETLLRIDERAAHAVAAVETNRKQAEGEVLLVQIEQRRDMLNDGDPDVHTAAARADADAVALIPTDDQRLLAQIVIGTRAERSTPYKTALLEAAPALADEALKARARVQASFNEHPGSSEQLGSSPDQSAPGSSGPHGEAEALESIRSRHAARRELGVPLSAKSNAEMVALMQADLADLQKVHSLEGLKAAVDLLDDCLEDGAYVFPMQEADPRTAKTLYSLQFDKQVAEMERKRKDEARSRRGIVGILIEEGQALRDMHDGQGEQLTFFMKYVNDTGNVGTAWGNHWPILLRAADARTGDLIKFRRKTVDERTPDTVPAELEVLERGQLTDDMPPDTPVAPNAARLTPPDDHLEGAQVSKGVAPPQEQGASPPQQPGQVSSDAKPDMPHGSSLDARDVMRLAARRHRDTAAARAAVGLPSGVELAPTSPAEAPQSSHALPSPDPAKKRAGDKQALTQQQPPNPMANGITGEPATDRPVPSKDIARLLESVTYEIRSNGSVLYSVKGNAAFVDHGQQILMHDAGNEEDDAILAAILLAKEKWGKVEFTGTQAFKQRAIALLVKHNVDLQLKNAEQDAARRHLASTQATAAKPGVDEQPFIGKRQAAASSAAAVETVPAISTPKSAGTDRSRSAVLHASSSVDPSPSAPVATTASETPPASQPVLAKDLAPIRASEWWNTQRAAIEYWAKDKESERSADLAVLGPQPARNEFYWFDKGGRRCDPPVDAKAFIESVAAADANLVESSMTGPNRKQTDPAVLLRGVTKEGDEFKTNVLLFKGQGDYLQGFIRAGEVKHQVIVHINKRKPDEDGVIRPNFLKVAELVGSGDKATWKEIGYGNAVNHRGDGKKVYFDEVLFNVGQEVVKARITSKVDAEMHSALGFFEGKQSRKAAPNDREAASPKAVPAAQALEGAAGEEPGNLSRRSARPRAAA